MKKEIVNVMGMELERWEHESCTADFGVGDDWATLYDISSKEENRGHATQLLTAARHYYEAVGGKKFGGSVALSESMKHIYEKLGIEEYL